MADRLEPYGAFNYIVNFGGEELLGGFSDVSGLGMEINVSEYRNGNEKENRPRKIPNTYKVTDVTLKRGIVDSSAMWSWLEETRTQGPSAKKTVVIMLQDEAHNDVMSWTLTGVLPTKLTGPTLAAKGAGEVAMDELGLAGETIAYEFLAA
jgi:phage tail-like protein